MAYSPVPLSTPIADSLTLSTSWFVWFRNLSQYVVESFTLKTKDNLKYIVSFSTLFVKYDSENGGEITLPYKSLSNQSLQYYFFENNVWNVGFLDVLKDDLKITLPEKKIKIESYLFINRS